MKPRWWWPYTIACLSIVLSSWSLWRSYHTPKNASPPHVLATNEPASPSFYANERAVKHWYVTDPICAGGAVGDDAHDDTAAINACTTNALAGFGDVFFPSPPVAYKITSEIPVNGQVRWHGESPTVLGTIIRAHSAMRSMVALRGTFGSSNPEGADSPRGEMNHLTFDANNLANSGLLLIGAEYTYLHDIRIENANGACIRDALLTLAPTVGSVVATVPGGSPGGVTVSQVDPNFSGIPNASAGGSFSIVHKIATTGALDVATFQTSFNGGSTYQTLTQPVSASAFPVSEDNTHNSTGSIGILATFPAGTYHAGDTYAYTVTINNGDYAQGLAGNQHMTFVDVVTEKCGSLALTSGAAGTGKYGGFNSTIVPGTVAVTAGSPNVVGTGTHFTQYFGAGASRGALWVNTAVQSVPSSSFQILSVLSDTVMTVTHGTEPTASASGLDFAFGTYGGYYEDGLVDGRNSLWIGGSHDADTVGGSYAGGEGPVLVRTEIIGIAMMGYMFGGGPNNNCLRAELHNTQGDSQVVGPEYYLSPNSSGEIIQPRLNTIVAGSGAGWRISQDGNLSPLAPFGTSEWLNEYATRYVVSAQTLTTAGQQIALPDFVYLGASNHTSFINVTTTGAFVLTATPLMKYPGASGALVILRNAGFQPFTLQPDALQSTGLDIQGAYEKINPQDVVAFVSTGNPAQNIWREIWHTTSYGANWGNQGFGRGPPVQTTTNTATELYRFNVANAGIAAGTAAEISVTASTTDGVNWAHWLFTFSSDTSGNSQWALLLGTGSGSGGVPPFSWTVTSDPSGTTPYAKIYGTGDNSHTVRWMTKIESNDGSQN